MASKLMASSSSRDSDLKRKLSARASASTTDFLRIDSSSNARDNSVSDSVRTDGFLRNAYVERNSSSDQGHGQVVEGESNSDTLLNAEITLLDAAGAVTPISDGEVEPPRVVRKTVDDVWREIVAGKRSEQKPKEEMMTLEDFLVKAGAVEEDASVSTGGVVKVKEEGLNGGIYAYENNSGVIESGVGMGVDVEGSGRGREVQRSLSLLEPLDTAAQQRQRRMIKNRESAARSRERKQAYQVELELMAVRLEEENEQLLKEKGERARKRLKQLMENVIPVIEKRRPPHLRRVCSMQW